MINLSICCMGFLGNPGFKTSHEYLLQFLKEGDGVVENFDECNTLIMGDFLQPDEMMKICQNPAKAVIMFVGEPRNKFQFSNFSDMMWNATAYHMAYGCIANRENRWIKYPLYVAQCKEGVFNQTNTFVQTNDALSYTTESGEKQAKRFAALINRHDPANTREKVYEEMLQLGLPIDCPGEFKNNCSNEELNRIGKPEWLKRYMFNICFENHVDAQKGYITEKLMDACLSGTVPIYNGTLDDVDAQIFNKDRIIFYHSPDYAEKMDWLMASPANYEEFYKQPVFMPTAWQTVSQMTQQVANMFDACRDIVLQNQHRTAVQTNDISPVKDE